MTDNNPRGQSPLSRIFCLEGVMAGFGLYSLVTGLWYGEVTWIFWGGLILTGLGLLTLVRRRDWQKHWEELGASGRAPRPPEGGQDGARGEGPHD